MLGTPWATYLVVPFRNYGLTAIFRVLVLSVVLVKVNNQTVQGLATSQVMVQ